MIRETDIFQDSREVEEILADTYSKIESMIRQNVIDIAKEYDKKIETIDNLNHIIQAKQEEIRELESTVDKAQERFLQSERYDIPKQYMNRIIKEEAGGYKPGDTVYTISHVREHIRCLLCSGERSIEVNVDDGQSRIVCPECKGNGYKSVSTPIVKEAKIDTIYLKLGFSESGTSLWSSDTIYLKGWDFPMKASDIYSTEEEAERAIKTMSAKRGKKTKK